MEFPGNAADRVRAAGLGKSAVSYQPKIPIPRGSHVFTKADWSRSNGDPVFAMKPTRITDDPKSHPTKWSAPLGEVPPGRSAKFHIRWRQRLVEGFVVNFGGRYYAYVNYCIHAGTPLDWWPNEFFGGDGRFLTCGTHGSLYEPASGKCAGGPCAGGALFPLNAQIVGDTIVVTANSDG